MNQRVIVRKPGGLEALELVQAPVPEPPSAAVRLRVLASGVAYGDVLLRKGVGRAASGYPVIPGYDVVGVVDALGPGVTRVAVGDTVAALPITGGYQQYLCLPETEVFRVPPGLDPAEVVSVMLNFTTAYQLLTRAARLKAGDSALVHGAAGGVGTAMLQLAGLLGIQMYGTVSTGKMEIVRELGGIPIDYTRSDFVQQLLAQKPGPVQAVFDPVGGAQLSRSYQVLARGGRLVVFGASAAAQGHPLLGLLSTGLRLAGLALRPDGPAIKTYLIEQRRRQHPEQFRQDVETLLGWLEAGHIRPQVARVLPLAEARQAHEALEQSRVSGKIVLTP